MMKPKRISLLLWHKLLLLIVGSIVVLALGLAFATWRSLDRASRQIGLDGKEILSAQTETFLMRLVKGQADTLDLQLAQAQAAAAHGAIFLSENLAAGSLDSAHLDNLLPALLERATNSTTIYFVTSTGDLWVYPALDPSLELPPDFDLTRESFFPTSSAFQNRVGEVVWSQVHVNPLIVKYDLVVDAIAPVVSDGARQGYVGVSVSLTQLIAQFNQQQPIRGSYSFLVDKDRRLVAAPPHARVDLSPPTTSVTRGIIDLSDTGNPALNAVLQNMVLGQASLEKVVIKGELKYIAYQPLSNIDWRLGVGVPVSLVTAASAQLVEVVEAGTQQALTGMLFWAGGLLLVALVVGGVLTRRLTSSLRDMAVVAESIAGGDLERRVEVTSRDEVGDLARAFNSMTAQLRDLIGSLEQRVAERTRDLSEMVSTQERLLDTIRQMSTPVIPIFEGIVVLPLVGHVDSQRAQQIMGALLQGIGHHQAEVAIIDITGVPVVDTAVANYLMQTAQAVRLLGAEPVLVGIRPNVAQTILDLGVDLEAMAIKANLQDGLAYALQSQGLALGRNEQAQHD